jgi:hypothetical protein
MLKQQARFPLDHLRLQAQCLYQMPQIAPRGSVPSPPRKSTDDYSARTDADQLSLLTFPFA